MVDVPDSHETAGQPRAKPDRAAAARLLADLAARGTGLGFGTDLGGDTPAPLTPLDQMSLARGRVHELTGPARRALAAVAAGVAQAEGPVLWLRPGWRSEGLCPQGLAALVPDPGALIVANCARAPDLLWGMEEALRAGCVALVVSEVTEMPDLRQVRRLHLAAADGVMRNRLAGRMHPAPLGLLLAHEVADGRIAGVESRWALHPLPPRPPARFQSTPIGDEEMRWRLDRQLMRGLPPKDWEVRLGCPYIADSGEPVENGQGEALLA